MTEFLLGLLELLGFRYMRARWFDRLCMLFAVVMLVLIVWLFVATAIEKGFVKAALSAPGFFLLFVFAVVGLLFGKIRQNLRRYGTYFPPPKDENTQNS